jgi:hypothetical protein
MQHLLSILLFLLLPIVSLAGKGTMTITITNSTKSQVTVFAGNVADANGIPRSFKEIKTMGASDAPYVYTTTSKKGTYVWVYAVLEGGGKTPAREFLIENKVNNADLTLSVNRTEIDAQGSLTNVLAQWNNFSEIKKEYHMTANLSSQEAFKTLLGAFVLVRKDMPVLIVNSSAMGTDNVDYILEGRNISFKQDLKRETAVDLQASIPLAANLSAMFGDSEISQLEWNVVNATPLLWRKDGMTSHVDAFTNKLSKGTLDYMVDEFIRDPNLKLYFIDMAYYVGSYSLRTSNFKKLTSDNEISVSVFGSGKVNYIRSNESITADTRLSYVTDVWGSDATGNLKTHVQKRAEEAARAAALANTASANQALEPMFETYGISSDTLTISAKKNALSEKLRIARLAADKLNLPMEQLLRREDPIVPPPPQY